jgi:hypothetical protein
MDFEIQFDELAKLIKENIVDAKKREERENELTQKFLEFLKNEVLYSREETPDGQLGYKKPKNEYSFELVGTEFVIVSATCVPEWIVRAENTFRKTLTEKGMVLETKFVPSEMKDGYRHAASLIWTVKMN